MTNRFSVTLNNTALTSVDNSIVIRDINYHPPEINLDTSSVAKREGMRVQRKHIDSCSVTIAFEIRKYDTAARQSVCSSVVAWAANGGTLETGDRTGQMLICVCTKLPTIESVLRWTDAVTMTFTGLVVPYWQSKTATTLKLTGSSTSGTLTCPGMLDGAIVSASIKANAAVSSVALTVAGRTLTLSGLSLATNDVVNITYDSNMIQSIKVGSTSLLDKRTGVDDLIANKGNNTVAVSASASVEVTFSVRGLWL